eukprot:CAMPEP_0171241976 /NCGR_PEP_ID=MMETSP0790-20130122/45401_1 /TAXON_ID=2925 /ORGANISM="Alexandrium catenella, Strain OF101" /LENGTH=109 /DNA_ID=CAMNT_0011708659 /DNA_START=64 /DNA_END=389 /DNA_ORIENTATION=+
MCAATGLPSEVGHVKFGAANVKFGLKNALVDQVKFGANVNLGATKLLAPLGSGSTNSFITLEFENLWGFMTRIRRPWPLKRPPAGVPSGAQIARLKAAWSQMGSRVSSR